MLIYTTYDNLWQRILFQTSSIIVLTIPVKMEAHAEVLLTATYVSVQLPMRAAHAKLVSDHVFVTKPQNVY